jgi:hypothetical protein
MLGLIPNRTPIVAELEKASGVTIVVMPQNREMSKSP